MRALVVVAVALLGCDQGAPPAPAKPTPPGPGARPIVEHAAYCAGAVAWPGGAHTCTTDADCASDQRCWPDGLPDYSGMCGAYMPPKIDCNEDKDCGRKEVCVDAGRGPCDGTNRSCVPRCTAKSCAADETCAKSGHCEPTSCKAGFACAAGYRCTGDTQHAADPHGCEMIGCWEPGGQACPANMRCNPNQGCGDLACKTSSDCDCGACMDGYCRSRPGVCAQKEPPSPPPAAAPAPPPPAPE